MKILIVSDTHRRNDNFIKIIEKMPRPDTVIHCGDVEGGEYAISQCAGWPVGMVAGNNDVFSDLPREREFMLGDYKVWLTHGHSYYVSMGNEMLKQEAVAKGVDIVMYGHTHIPDIDDVGEIICLNPGSLSEPRQIGYRHTYIVATTDDEGDLSYELKELE